MVNLQKGDCLDLMGSIPDHSVDMILLFRLIIYILMSPSSGLMKQLQARQNKHYTPKKQSPEGSPLGVIFILRRNDSQQF